jgi:hypothetical protein
MTTPVTTVVAPPLGLTTLPQTCPPQGSLVPPTPPDAPATPEEPAPFGVEEVSVPEQPGSTAAVASAPDAKDNNKYDVRLFAILCFPERGRALAMTRFSNSCAGA